MNDARDRFGLDIDALLLGWNRDGALGFADWERSDLDKVEQAFGVRLRFPHATSQLRQTRADHGDVRALLHATVERRN
ncbi:hypothetical protein [Burkholderia sp. BCC1630]|uniref:hypothetical protein n=1 Tax=Burkholderia sp. BCC1630 TaxID=2676304 RepID=UPI0015887CA4|nr:hypothetical protein [Burkholderia sp. BCC1630]